MREGNRPIGRACAGWMRNERGQQTHRLMSPYFTQVTFNSEEGAAQLSWQPVDLPSESLQYEVLLYRHHGTMKETVTHVYK